MIHTTSAIISFYVELEDKIKKFYEDLARNEKYSESREMFLAFAMESKKQREIVLKSYWEIITNKIEAGLPLTGLNESNYELNTELKENQSCSDILKMAIDIEEKSYKFCIDSIESLKALLTDITQVFELVAKKKAKRKKTLKSLI